MFKLDKLINDWWNRVDKKKAIIHRFFNIFSYEGYKGYWEDFLNGWVEEYKPKTDKVIICNPLKNIGIVDIKKFEEIDNIGDEWTEYDLKKTIKDLKKQTTYITKNGFVYLLSFIIDIVNKFFKNQETFNVRVLGKTEDDFGLLCFMIDGEWAIGLTNKLSLEFEVTQEGVWFLETDNDGKQTGRKFANWINNSAFVDITYLNVSWKKAIFKFNYYFDIKVDDMGDMLLI